MKNLLIILSAAIVAGLSVYFCFGAAIRVMGNTAVMELDTLVWFIACLTLAAAIVALLLRWAVTRGDARLTRELEDRLARLEQRNSAAT